MTELRFPSPGWKFYIRGFSLSGLGIVLAVVGVVIVAVDPWDWAGVISMLGGALGVIVGLVIMLLVWFTFIYGTITIWRRWRQLRRPPAIIGADGVRYLAVRRPTNVPWQDIEEILLDRDLLPGNVVTKVAVRMAPGAAVLRDGPVNVPGTRYLNIGLLSDLDIPEEQALRFLGDTAGSRLKIEETDRRTPSAAGGLR